MRDRRGFFYVSWKHHAGLDADSASRDIAFFRYHGLVLPAYHLAEVSLLPRPGEGIAFSRQSSKNDWLKMDEISERLAGHIKA